MENLDLKSMGVLELTPHETRHENGGWLDRLGALLLGAAIAIIYDWDNFKKGLAGEPEIRD